MYCWLHGCRSIQIWMQTPRLAIMATPLALKRHFNVHSNKITLLSISLQPVFTEVECFGILKSSLSPETEVAIPSNAGILIMEKSSYNHSMVSTHIHPIRGLNSTYQTSSFYRRKDMIGSFRSLIGFDQAAYVQYLSLKALSPCLGLCSVSY
jgi:hypothetical protein